MKDKDSNDDIQKILAGITHRIWLDVYNTDRREPTPLDKVHVGDITAECVRHAAYSLTAPFSFHSLQTTINFWHGRLLHSRPLLRHATQELALEWERIIGHVDEYSPDDGGTMLEKKSTSHVPDRPHVIHIRQAEYYKVLLERTGHPCRHVFVVYFLKDMSPRLPTVLPVDARGVSFIAEEMIRKRDFVLLSRKNKLLPPPLFGADCYFCNYVSLCFGDKIYE